MECNTIIVEEEETSKRLDKLLTDRFSKESSKYSRTYFQYLIDSQLVLVNGNVVKKRVMPACGDEIEIQFALTPETSLEPENIPLDILYEDEDLLIINKPAGMVVHPGAGNPRHTFVNALLYYCKQLPQNGLRPGIVHRLDKETSGLMIAAKTERAQERFVMMFANRQIKKEYLAICLGNPGKRILETQIGRHPEKRTQMTVVEENGKEAKTHMISLGHDERFSVVKLIPETGRTHQLRVHLQYVKTPILGDNTYGNEQFNKKIGVARTLLHARHLHFTHPFTGQKLDIEAPIPDDFKKYTDLLLK